MNLTVRYNLMIIPLQYEKLYCQYQCRLIIVHTQLSFTQIKLVGMGLLHPTSYEVHKKCNKIMQSVAGFA